MKISLERLDHILKNGLGLNPYDEVIDAEIIQAPRGDREHFDRVRDEYRLNLQTHPNRHEVSKRLYVEDDLIIYIRTRFPRSEVAGLGEEYVLYYPYCTIAEIKRIENVANADDYLLKLRADAIADNPRTIRIFHSRQRNNPAHWSLSSFYQSDRFDRFKARLSALDADACGAIPAGFAFLREPNGACIRSDFGNVIVISEALEHFLYYMNLHLFARQYGCGPEDAMASFVIACKIMLRTEALDFDLDPRGELPADVDERLSASVQDQLQFVIGHEYAHALLGHLHNAVVADGSLILSMTARPVREKYYTPRETQEFEADVASILRPLYTDEEVGHFVDAATVFFLCLDLFYIVQDYINPALNREKTHPNPIDRIWALRRTIHEARPNSALHSYADVDLHTFLDNQARVKQTLSTEFLPFQVEIFENLSSIYLPGYHQKKLFDRFDY